MIGEKFGNWIVLELDAQKSGKNIYYLCECQCEARLNKSVRKNSLLDGISASCGCLTRKIYKETIKKNGTVLSGNAAGKIGIALSSKKRADDSAKKLIGQKFNSLTIISVQAPKVTCRCDCGNEKVASRSDVVSGKTTSCGCERLRRVRENRGVFESWIGRKFHFLTVIEDLPYHVAKVRCDCGVEKEVLKTRLRTGDSKSCGCKSEEMRFATNLKKYGSFTRGVSTSKAEIEIKEWIESLGMIAGKGYIEKGKGRLEIDVYVPEKQIGIEHNGLRWHCEGSLDKRDLGEGRRTSGKWYHLNKSDLAKKQGIRIIHIWDKEWKDRKKQIKSFLRSALGKNEIKIPARKTILKEIEFEVAAKFLDEYHIQGRHSGGSSIGVFHGDELVGVSTFSKHHRDAGKTVLSRWCVKENVTIQGGLSKIMKNANKIIRIDSNEITSWADLRMSDYTGYLAAGWKLEEILPPDYFYFDKNKKKTSTKQSRKKGNVNTPEGMTEFEHATKDGLSRIWDCGKARLSYKLK